MFRILLALAAAGATILSPAASSGNGPTSLFEVLSEALPAPGVPAIAEYLAEIDLASVREATSLRINAPFHFGIAQRTRLESRPHGGFLWYGRTEAADEVLITADGTYLNALISGPTGRWVVKPLQQAHLLVRVDTTAEVPPDEVVDPFQPDATKHDHTHATHTAATRTTVPMQAHTPDGTVSTIDFLVLYTAEARAGAGGDAQIRNVAQHLIDQSNQAFENSLVDNVRYRLRHMSLSAMADYGQSYDDLLTLVSRPGLSQRRAKYGADSVILLNESFIDWAAGVAYIQRSPGPAFSQFAVGIVSRHWSQWGNPIFAHEAGHILGMEHDPGAAGIPPNQASFPWSLGHHTPRNPSNPPPDPGFHTVMAYAGACGTPCTRLLLFSNPDIILDAPYAGLAAGITDERDNARTARLLGPGNSLFYPETDTLFASDLEFTP